MIREFFLQENVLTDNVLFLPIKGKVFKGGYNAIIKEYVFQNSWSDKEIITKFRTKERLISYLNKHYPDVEIDMTGTNIE